MKNLYPGSIYTSGRFYNIFFFENEDNDEYTREVTTFWDVISDIGGLIEILLVVFAGIVSFQAKFLY